MEIVCESFDQSTETTSTGQRRDSCKFCGRTSDAHYLHHSCGHMYRAVLVNVPNLERVQQILSLHVAEVESWAARIKGKYPTGKVLIFVQKEHLLNIL